jgi:hypothetical protein
MLPDFQDPFALWPSGPGRVSILGIKVQAWLREALNLYKPLQLPLGNQICNPFV